jgi:uncharacterized protein (TIGR01777 family)
MKMKILVTGATGFVGQVVVKHLIAQNHEVVVLTRNITKAVLILGSKCQFFQWADTNELPPVEAFEGVDGVINLMGENIGAKRWTPEQKKVIYNSRIDGTARLVERIKTLKNKPQVFASASAIGIYGVRGNEELIESSDLGQDFLSYVCKDWEAEAFKAEALGVRTVVLRTGVVLGRGGGALHKMLPVFKGYLGGVMGEGTQYMSWIHVEDLASMYVEAVTNPQIQGVLNATAPYPATNAEFTRSLGKVLKRPTFVKIPTFILKKLLGEMATLVLDGQKVIPARIKSERFRYRYPTLEMALKETAY